MEPAPPPEIEVVEASYAGRNRSGVEVSFGPVSMRVSGGEFLSLIGPASARNGILLRMIAGLDLATSGEIRISGRKVESTQQGIGVVFREPSLLDWRTGLENVLFGCEARMLDLAQCRAQARRLLAAMGIPQCENQRPSEVPVGLAQRVSICRALLPGPSILLMDDPFHHLDGFDREQLATDIQRLWLTPRVTTVLCTSSINEAIQLSDRVVVMAPDGRILQSIVIDLPRPRRLDKTTTPQIAEHSSLVRMILHAAGLLS